MSDKDINIHVKTPGAGEAKQQLDKTAEGVRGLGTTVQGSGEKAGSASGKWSLFFSLFAGVAIAAAIRGVVGFFDKIKEKADMAINKADEVRKAYEGLFEAFGAYDEKSRKGIVKKTEQLLLGTGTPGQVGYPTVEKYARQFKEVMPAADYDVGLRNALSYAARHGGTATPELIDLMRGYGMTTAKQQSEFIRTVGAAATQSGMTDEDIITALGRAAPSARAMGWSPQETISKVAALAAGETGRNKSAMPSTVIEAMASPQNEGLKKYGITGQTPNEIIEGVRKKSQGMSAQARYKMLEDIYGAGAVKGVYKLMTVGAPTVAPVSEAADRAEQESYMQTMEARDAQAKAKSKQFITQTKTSAQYAEDVREMGRAAAAANATKNPKEQGVLDLMGYLIPNAMAEWAAYKKWEESLSDEQRESIQGQVKQFRGTHGRNIQNFGDPATQEYWYRMITPQIRFKELTQPEQNQDIPGGGPITINYHYDNSMRINERIPDARSRIDPNDL